MALGSLKMDARPASLYEADFHRWTQEQARALRDKRAPEIDWESVAEEIETLGRSGKSEIASRMNVLLLHLLKWEFQPNARSSSWRASIVDQRRKLQRLLRENASLRAYPAEILAEEYEIARLKAAGETELAPNHFPEAAPYSADEALLDSFSPGGKN